MPKLHAIDAAIDASRCAIRCQTHNSIRGNR
jgi:hypothetical protein